ncbi:MAG TPA: hypothetical protein PL110_17695 [Candidatus Eremiobacteraeota bacterium]|nr:MAG: hypothetical protein BWY64_03540 [bacterium ADurb.Bin363]HPZ09930.1 hypothetical protein [Candidatus Eremiobacteraeota bacterium]
MCTKRAFSLVEVLWGVFLLATAIVVISGVILSALQAIKKSEGLMEATNIMMAEKAKFMQRGYSKVALTSPESYKVDNYYVIYKVEGYDYPDVTGSVTNELKIVTMGVYNVSPEKLSSAYKDRLVRVITTAVLFYDPNS